MRAGGVRGEAGIVLEENDHGYPVLSSALTPDLPGLRSGETDGLNQGSTTHLSS